MIRRHGATLRALLMVTDAVVAATVVLVVYQLRFLLLPGEPAPDMFEPAWAPVALYAGAWVAVLYLRGLYRLRAHWSVRGHVAAIARATGWLAVLTSAALFATRLDDVSRVFVLLLFPAQFLATAATRLAVHAFVASLRRRGRNLRFIVVVGTGSRAIEFVSQVERQPMLGLRILGFVADTRPGSAVTLPYLGPIRELDRIFRENVVDEVAICLPPGEAATAEMVSQMAQAEGKLVRIPLEVPRLHHGRSFIEDLDGNVMLTLMRGPDQVFSLALKRALDIVGATLGLVLLSPVLVGVALYIVAHDGAPVLFSQVRVGENGRRFRILKFRTMTRDAEERYADVRHLNDMRGAAFKIVDDPRITGWGRTLRRFSLDDLPQLWNILKGDMSLVGPRPAPPREVDIYDPWQRRRLSMKPGLTGLWQISSRHSEDFDERASLDLEYIDQWSLLLDLKIVARTLPVVLRPTGQ